MSNQIEEMANVICESCAIEHCAFVKKDKLCPQVLKDATALYNAGWRKQIEGEWVKVMNHRECSNCGYNAPYKKIKAGDHLQDLTKHCPNCGAHMRGGKNE